MSELLVLRGKDSARLGVLSARARVFDDAEALVGQVRDCAGRVAWVAIASDVDDASAVAKRVREADSSVGIFLLGDGGVPPELLGGGRALEADKLAAMTALTAGIAHDVGTPMTAILGYAELLAKSVDDEKNRKRAKTIVEQVQRVSELIEILMSLTRADERAPMHVELTGILDSALDFYREKFGRRGIQVARDYRPAPEILGNPGRLQQVFLNLFLNAIDAMPEGGTLRVALAQGATGGAEVRIADTGTGIDPALRARVFEPYFSTKERVTGRGLGLLLVKTIVEEHGGQIELVGEPTAETQFRLRFPPIPG